MSCARCAKAPRWNGSVWCARCVYRACCRRSASCRHVTPHCRSGLTAPRTRWERNHLPTCDHPKVSHRLKKIAGSKQRREAARVS